ncbi:hypothetical protein PMAYCL1PPCAC_04147, partial [Pristionchus mayeri]
SRSKNAAETDTVSDPSEFDFDSDDSMKESRPPKNKLVKKEQKKPAAKKASPSKKQQKKPEGDEGMDVDDDEDDEQRGLAEDIDEEDLLNIKVPDAPIPCMAATGGNRLMITDITVENFKSYYGVRKIGPFHQSFTSIIGPNGSGKSNVIDALLFVFGYKASKIRSKKVSVLIHSSSGKDNLPSCTVTISFQKIIDKPDGTYDVVPNTGFNVSRTAYRNNSSDYRMDDKRVSFKEVAVRLKKVGIDLIHNRFLILQGEVEQIAMMKPKAVKEGEDGMLEYLEDIIGSSRFKMPIEKLVAKIDKLQAERSVQIAKVNSANRDKEALDEPVKTQIEYLTMQNEMTALQCKLHLLKKYRSEDAVAAKEPEKAGLEGEVAKAASTLAEVSAKLKEKKEASDAMTKEISTLQSSIHKTTADLENVVQKDKKRMNDLGRLTNEMKKMEAEVKKEQDKLEDVMKMPEDAKAKIEKLTEQLDKHREELARAQELFDENIPEYNKKTEGDRAKKTKMEEEYSGIAAKLATAESNRKIAENSLRTLMEEYEKKQAQLADLDRSLKAIEDKLATDKGEQTRVLEAIAKTEEEQKAAADEMKAIDERADQIKNRIADLAPLLTDVHQEAFTRQATNRITNAFEQAVAQGKMKGYLGRIGDLGSISAEFDRAISNNFAGKLDMYLVETNKTAAEGTEICKKINTRGTFLSLDRQQRFMHRIKEMEKEKNGYAPRLFNQIKCDDKFKPAFWFVVNDAYVTETITDAKALYDKIKAETKRGSTVVSRDGNMINYQGAIVGGGQIREGKMASGKTAPRRASAIQNDEAAAKKAEEAQREKRELDQEAMEIVRRRRELQMMLDRLGQKLTTQNGDKFKIEKSVKAGEDRMRIQTEQRANREAEVEKSKVDEKTQKAKREDIERLQKERDEAADESKAFKAKIKKIDNEMTKVYDDLVKPHETKTASERDAIDKAEKEMGKQQAVINGSERNIAKQQKKVADIEKDLEERREKTTKLTEEEATFEEAKKEKKERIEEAEKQKAEKDEQLKELRATAAELDKEEVALTKKQKELQEQLKEMCHQIKGMLSVIAEYDLKISKLELNNIADLLFEIPEDFREASTARRYLLDGESDSDLDDFEVFMTHSPTKKKELKETKRARKDEPTSKRRKVLDSTMADTEDEEEVKKEPAEAGEQIEMDQGVNTASTGDEEIMEEETPEERQARREAKILAKRANKAQREDAIKRGEMPVWSRRRIMKMNEDAVKVDLQMLCGQLEILKKQLQPHVLEDYKKKLDKLKSESTALADVKDKFNKHRDLCDDLKKERLDEFMGGFEQIATALREMYQMITLGGDASLELKDVIDPFLEGVQFM